MYFSLSNKRVLDLCCLSLLPTLTVLLLHINTNIYWHLQIHSHTVVISTLLVLTFLGGFKCIILFIFLPCKNAVFTSIKLILEFCEAISANIDLTSIHEQHEDSVGKSCNPSNPLAHSLALVILFTSTTFLLITHLADMQGFPESSSSSKYKFYSFQLFNYFVFASNTCFSNSVI